MKNNAGVRKSSRDAKTSRWKFDEEHYIYSFRVSSHKLLFHYKEKDSNFIAEKPGGHHLKQVVQVNITNTGTNQHRVFLIWSLRRTHHHFCGIPEKIQLTLEQHGLELRGSTYTWIFFPVVNTTVLHDLLLVESGGAEELLTERAVWKLYSDFPLCRELAPLTPLVVQGSTRNSLNLTTGNSQTRRTFHKIVDLCSSKMTRSRKTKKAKELF